MKIKSFLIFALIIGFVSVFALYPPKTGDPIEKEKLILKAITSFLDRMHFQPEQLDDKFSAAVYDNYIDMLDSRKRFLIQSELDQLKIYRTRLDDDIRDGNFDFMNKSIELYDNSVIRAKKMTEEILDIPMSFDAKEIANFDYENMAFAKDEKELRERWRQALKLEVLADVVAIQNSQEKDSTDTSEKAAKSFAEIEKEAREKVSVDYKRLFDRLDQLRREDKLSNYLNAITTSLDPHTNYMTPRDKEDFSISMSGKLEGIGARLQTDGEFTKVNEIVVGGPAWKQKELENNDVIMKVAQFGEEPLDIRGMRIDDVVSKIRGKKGTKVILTVKKVDGSTKDITITRDEVLMEESFAKSAILSREGVIDNIGYIYLPKFYADFDNNKGRFSFTDVAKEIDKLNKENVNGIILDLRNNPGGSLNDVVKMSGLFIESGPIVQVKSRGQEAYVMNDENTSYSYDGPLVILVNHQSASASEILAAAMQDYKRAVIIGSTSTYGKGTVQRIFNLDRAISGANEMKPLGELKVTIQKYYRIDGGSTQSEGVVPDIVLPDPLNYLKVGEREHKNAMEWSKISPASYNQNVFLIKNMDQIVTNSKARTEANETFVAIDKNARRIKERSDTNLYPLDIVSYMSDLEKRKAEDKEFNALFKEIGGLNASNLGVDLSAIQRDSASIGRNEVFLKGLRKDVYIDEALHVMKDLNIGKVASSSGTLQPEKKERVTK